MNRQYQAIVIISILILTSLSGCKKQAPDPMARLVVRSWQAESISYRIQWQQDLGLSKHNQIVQIVPLGDIIVVVETGHFVSILNANDGRIMWRKEIGDRSEVLSAPRRTGDSLIISSEANTYIYRIENGELINRIHLDFVAGTSPVLKDNLAIFGSPTGLVFAQNLTRGYHEWKYKMGGAILTDPVNLGGMVIVTDSVGTVAAFNALNGKLLWKRAAPPWKRITAQPAVGKTRVFVASEDQGLYGMSGMDGSYWRYLTQNPLATPPKVIDDRVFIKTDKQGLVCLEASTGKVIWKAGLQGMPVTRDRSMLLVSVENNLFTVDNNTGELVSTVNIPFADHIIADNVVSGNLFIAHNDGRIMKLAPKH